MGKDESTAMTDTFIENGKELHADMRKMLEARAAAGPAGTIEEQRQAWTNYSRALSKPHPEDMKVAELKYWLSSRGKSTTGNKAELVAR